MYFLCDEEKVYFIKEEFYEYGIPAEAVVMEGSQGEVARVERNKKLNKGRHEIIFRMPLALKNIDQRNFVAAAYGFYQDKLSLDSEYSVHKKGFKKILQKPYGEIEVKIDGKQEVCRSKTYKDHVRNQQNPKDIHWRNERVYCIYERCLSKGLSKQKALDEVHFWLKHGTKRLKKLKNKGELSYSAIRKIIKEEQQTQKN